MVEGKFFKMADLNFLENLLMEYLRGLSMEGRPTHERLYLDSVAHGNMSPVTESFFSPEELEYLRQAVMKTGRPIGALSYPQFGSGSYRVKDIAQEDDPGAFARLSLGSAKFRTEPGTGNIIVEDNYDFPSIPWYENLGGGIKFAAAHHLGSKVLPEESMVGRPIAINLGPLGRRKK